MSWFQGIEKPVETSSQTHANYIDRLCGNVPANSPRYFTKPKGNRNNQSSFRNNQSKRSDQIRTNKIEPDGKRANPCVATPGNAVDDAKWLEERRKKFPKPRSIESEPETIDHSIDDVSEEVYTPTNDNSQVNVDKFSKPNKAHVPWHRRRSLFEQLLD